MKYNTDDKQYLEKLRRDNPNRDIPNDTLVETKLSKMKNGSEKVIDDLIIRTWDGMIEFELI